MLAKEDRELIQKIGALAEKLLAETQRLRGDVTRLHGRIEPFDNEVLVKVEEHVWDTPKTLREAFRMISMARQYILNCEAELSAIRGAMDEIKSGAISREEMEPHILNSPRRRK